MEPACRGFASSNWQVRDENGYLAQPLGAADLKDEAGGRNKSRRPEPKRHATAKISDKDARKAAAEAEGAGQAREAGRQRRRRWTRRSGSTKNDRRPSTPNRPRSRSGSRPNPSDGRKKGKGWRPRCVARVTKASASGAKASRRKSELTVNEAISLRLADTPPQGGNESDCRCPLPNLAARMPAHLDRGV